MTSIRFSPRVYREVGRFFREHPVVELHVSRAADMGSPCVPLQEMICEKCGWKYNLGPLFKSELQGNLKEIGEEMPSGIVPEDLLRSIVLTHAWDQKSRSIYCGGRLTLSS